MNRDRELEQIKAKTFIGSHAAFLGCLLCGLRFCWDKSCQTAFVSASTSEFHWNPDWFDSLSEDARTFVLLHELWHIALLHGPRSKNRKHMKWNAACDYYINGKLIEDGYKMDVNGLYNALFTEKGLCEEEIYDRLPDQPEQQEWGSDLDPASAARTVSLVQSAITTAKLSGKLPGDVEKAFHDFVKPKLNWKVLLHRYLLDALDCGWSWSMPNRRFRDAYLPAFKPEDGRLVSVAMFLDTSGSISDEEIARFLSEARYVQANLHPHKLSLIQFDEKIQRVDEFTEFSAIKGFDVKGMGGTSYVPVHNWIMKNKPSLSLIFTDLYAEPMAPVGRNKVIWVVSTDEKPPFGECVYVNAVE